MVIGFTQRNQTVSESEAPFGQTLFELQIEVATMRPSEIEYTILYRLNNVRSDGIVVETLLGQTLESDAIFPGNPNEDIFFLSPGVDTIPSLTAFIRDDTLPENDECFTIRILSIDIPGNREIFSCNSDDSSADSFFCLHTICITDDDGEFKCLPKVLEHCITV